MSTSRNRKPWESVIGGGLTGALEICVTYPMKYVKTQLQLENKLGAEKKYAGVFDCARQTVRQHGVLGLYRGLNIFMYAPKAAIRFGAFETLKTCLSDDKGTLNATNRFICGLCAGAVESAVVVTPLETIEVKVINDLRTKNPRFRGFVHGARVIYREEGFRGLYQGLPASVIKQSTNQAIRFSVFGMLQSWYEKDNKPATKLLVLLFGGIAGSVSVLMNNPIDVVKTRMQGLDRYRYKHTLDCLVKVYKNEGFLSFYRGLTPRLSRVSCEVALTFFIYEHIQDSIRKLAQ